MPVDTLHPQFCDAEDDWKIMRDVVGGERAVKGAHDAYLPKLHKQAPEEYASYCTRAVFFGATGRTIEAHKGLVFRKDPEVKVPATLTGFLEDATMQGLSWYDFAKDTVAEVLTTGRRGTLVDWDQTGERRPYLVAYAAEQIINWKTERVRGRVMLSLLVLHEMDPRFFAELEDKTNKAPDEFEEPLYDQWRVYRLNSDGMGESYVSCTVYRRKNKNSKAKDAPEFVVVDSSTPTRRGIPLDRIPFVFHGPNNSLPDVDKIPLLDMANVNLSHYRTSADLENGRHMTGLPTPFAAGFDSKASGDLYLGSTHAWVSDNPDAKAGFIEFEGQGLQSLTDAIKEKEAQMAALGARMLEPEAKKAEAYSTVAMRSTGETSALMALAIACGESLSEVLRLAAWWNGTAANPADLTATAMMTINTDFLSARLTPEELAALTTAYSGGSIDFETLFFNLVRGELIEPDRTIEEVRASIEANPPGLLQFPPPEPVGGAAGGGSA